MAITKTESKDKPWRVDYRDPSGKRHRPAFKTKKEAMAYEAEQKQRLATGTWVDPAVAQKTTVAELYRLWHERVSTVGARGRRPVGPKTLAGYEWLWRKHMAPRWEHAFLASVTYEEVSDWVASLEVGNSTKAAVANVFGRIMSEAVRRRMLPLNPTKDAAGNRDYVPEVRRKGHTYLTMPQLLLLSERFEPPYDLMVVLAGVCGPRWGELTALTPDDVELGSQPMLTINKAYTDVQGRLHLGDTKTIEERNVPMPRLVADRLAKHLEGATAPTVFRSPTGLVLRASNFRTRLWTPAVEEAQRLDKSFPNLTLHGLRHTAVSLAIRGGANVKVVQAIAGHKSATITLDTYAGLFMDDLHDSASRLNESLRASGWN
ncbi:tyrosine-type recombinase/integrase [Glutamicibacter creatinolyticus]|uniref:tyrosine-type recombinase/integrase n=1 Tax=Glutamicibacter creatinolyticus TaxID=162496 RepID=UPI003216777D